MMHLELSRAGTTVPHLYLQEVWKYLPREVRRYHSCTSRRYDGTTLVPGGGTPVKSHLEVNYPLSSPQFICFAILSKNLGRRAAVQLQVRS